VAISLRNQFWLAAAEQVVQHLQQLALLAAEVALAVVVGALAKMRRLLVVAVMAQYLFGLGSLINENMY
jgi:hypothetical protein